MKKFIQILFSIFLLLFPFSIRWVVYEQASYRFGNFNPWVTGFVYLPEILLLLIFVLWFIIKIRDKQTIELKSQWLWILFFLFALNVFVVTFLNGNPFLGALFILRLFEGLVVFWLITDKVLPSRTAVTLLLFSAILQILWGYAQWRLNHSLGLSFLGESVIGSDVLGVAKIDLADGAKQIRAYGSFLHPNILAAYLLVIFFIALNYLKYGYKLFWLALFTWGVYLAHSRAAMLVGVVALGMHFMFTVFRTTQFRKSIALIIVLLLTIVNFWFFKNSHIVPTRDLAWQERLDQNMISHNMWQQNPWGVGVRNFTLTMEQFPDCRLGNDSDCTARKYLPWEFQPVHNTYFLILNEIGIQGLLILFVFLLVLFDFYWKAGKAVPILILLFLAPFDHFLWDSWTGMMLVALVAGFFALQNHKEGVVEHVVNVVTHHESES